MDKFSSEATKAGFQEPEKPVSEMTEEELKRFRASFDPDMMGFDGTEGADEEEETKMASKPKINKMITKVNFSDSNRSAGQIKYLVKHFVGATGGAEANCRYFYDTYRGASAHFFVGHNGEIWQCVEENDTAWHCGAKTYKHKECRMDCQHFFRQIFLGYFPILYRRLIP